MATKPGCAPLKEAYRQAAALRPKAWGIVEHIFLRGMEGFDQNVSRGIADMGDLQNGKGDFLNDLLALILENCAQVQLYSRGGVPGLIFPKHHLDVTYPSEGAIEFIVEAKAVGTPKHPGNPAQKAIGRAGSADLDKRIKEIGFKTIDLKAEYARILAERGDAPSVMTGDLTTWLRSVKPKSYVFFAARVVGDKDRERVIRFADVAGLVSDAVGVFCFRPISSDEPARYRAESVPPHIEMARVLFRACQDLAGIRERRPVEPPGPSPAADADRLPTEGDANRGD
ncbi:MAG: hypothetical protein ACT4PJ_13055 [Gemmatimonadaceae bacterium]